MGSIRISDENNEKLKEIKRKYDLENINQALEIAIRNTPSPINIKKQPPALTIQGDYVDNKGEYQYGTRDIYWTELINSKRGDIFKVGELGSNSAYSEIVEVLDKEKDQIILKKVMREFTDPSGPYINIEYFNFKFY